MFRRWRRVGARPLSQRAGASFEADRLIYTVYVRRGSTLYGVNRAGRQTWHRRVEGGASVGTQTPVVRGGRVYVATADGLTQDSAVVRRSLTSRR